MSIAAGNNSTSDLASAPATNTVTKPTGTASTDIMIACFGSDTASTGLSQTITPPAGWTRISTQISVVGTVGKVVCDAFWSLGSNTNLGFGNSSTGANWQQGYVVTSFSGVDNTTPIDVTAANSSNTGVSTLPVAAQTPATTGAVDCLCVADWGGGVFTMAPRTVNENGHTNASAAVIFDTTNTLTAGVSTGTGTLANSVGGTAQILEAIRFALRPGSAASGAKQQIFMRSQSVRRAAFY